MTKAKIITLSELYPVCPQCGAGEWAVKAHRASIDILDDILGLECLNCGFTVKYREEE